MNNLLCNGRVDAHEPRAKEIAARHTRNRYELPALAVIPFKCNGQMNSVVHLNGDFDGEVSLQLLRQPNTGLNCVRIVIVRGGCGDTPVRLAGLGDYSESANVRFGQALERKFSEAEAVRPQSGR